MEDLNKSIKALEGSMNSYKKYNEQFEEMKKAKEEKERKEREENERRMKELEELGFVGEKRDNFYKAAMEFRGEKLGKEVAKEVREYKGDKKMIEEFTTFLQKVYERLGKEIYATRNDLMSLCRYFAKQTGSRNEIELGTKYMDKEMFIKGIGREDADLNFALFWASSLGNVRNIKIFIKIIFKFAQK